MPKILVVESNTAEVTASAAALGVASMSAVYTDALRRLAPDVAVTVTAPYDEPPFAALEDFQAVIFTGATVRWRTDDPRERPLADLMERVFAAGLPSFGSCNGMQLAAVVLGGAVGPSPKGREDGMARRVALTEAGAAHPMMAGRSPVFAAPCVHRDEVQRLPEGAILLAGNPHCRVQAFAYDRGGVRFWGTQYHPEFEAGFLARYLTQPGLQNPDLSATLTRAASDPDAAAALGTSVTELSDAVRLTELRNWLNTVGNP